MQDTLFIAELIFLIIITFVFVLEFAKKKPDTNKLIFIGILMILFYLFLTH